MRGVITFVFDDGYRDVFKRVIPLLEKYGFKGVFAVPVDYERVAEAEGREIESWQKWLGVRKYGHEIAAHSVTHCNLTKIPDDQLELELSEPRRFLGAVTIVYPGGAHNDKVVKQAGNYYRAGRTVLKGMETLPPKDNMRLKVFNYSKRNYGWLIISLRVLQAWIGNKWVIETYHLVEDLDADASDSVDIHNFEKHLKFISYVPIANKTIKEVVR